MKQALFHEFGPAHVIRVEDQPRPEPKQNQVLVRVAAAAVNPKDTFIRKGYYTLMTGKKFPMGIGFDYSGVVEESRHPAYREGDPVYGMINGWKGTAFAEYLVAGENEIAPAPDSVALEMAAAIPLAGQTALQALRDLGQIKPGFKVCINGASGGVGTFAIQIARTMGGIVTTLTSPANFGLCKELGATYTEDYNSGFLNGQAGFDLFFDVFGNLSIGQVSGLLDGPAAVREQAAALLAAYDVTAAVEPLLAVLDSREEPAGVRAAAVKAVGRLNREALARRMRTLLRDPEATVRSAARGLLGSIDEPLAVAELAAVLDEGSVIEQQAAIESLVGLETAAADDVLAAAMARQAAGDGPPAIRLDLLLAAEARQTPPLQEAVAAIEAGRDASDRLAAWRECLAGGNVEQGWKIFHENTTASCLRCHQVNGKGGEVGPDLSEVGRHKPAEYLLESIVDPNAVIAKGFATVQFLLADGRLAAGIVREETADAFRIITPEAKELVIAKNEIDETSAGLSGMPADIAKQLTKSQIRDLIAYLVSLQKERKPTGHDE